MVQSVSKTVKNEAKEKSGFLSFVLGTLGASLLEHLATGKGGKAEIPRYGQMKERLKQARICNVAQSIKSFLKTKKLSKWIWIW